MTTLYKLTDVNARTYRQTQWGPGVEHTDPDIGDLYTEGWFYATTDPLLAVLLDPIQGDYLSSPGARLWEAEGDVRVEDHGLKVECTRIRTLQAIPIPEITTEQRMRFGIFCARMICKDQDWNKWAKKWLDGSDRSKASVCAAWGNIWLDAAPKATIMVASSVLRGADKVAARDVANSAIWTASHWAAKAANLNFIEIAREAMRN